MRRVIVHIDRLALHGVPGLDAHAVRRVTEALQRELSGRLADPGLTLAARQDTALQLATPGTLPVGAAQGPAALGRAVGSAVATALGAGMGTGKGTGRAGRLV